MIIFIWLSRLVTEDREDIDHAEKSYHLELEHHEEMRTPLHSLKIKRTLLKQKMKNLSHIILICSYFTFLFAEQS